MAEAEQRYEQCKAVTADGERCSREAGEDGFCHQHGPDDETIDDGQEQSDDTEATEQTDDDTDTEPPMQQEDVTEPTEVDLEGVDVDEDESIDIELEDEQLEGLLGIRRRIEHAADAIIGHPLDTISEIQPTEEGWIAVVDVIERRAVPDTQDILGRYELTLEEDGSIRGYERLDRYRRGDTAAFE